MPKKKGKKRAAGAPGSGVPNIEAESRRQEELPAYDIYDTIHGVTLREGEEDTGHLDDEPVLPMGMGGEVLDSEQREGFSTVGVPEDPPPPYVGATSGDKGGPVAEGEEEGEEEGNPLMGGVPYRREEGVGCVVLQEGPRPLLDDEAVNHMNHQVSEVEGEISEISEVVGGGVGELGELGELGEETAGDLIDVSACSIDHLECGRHIEEDGPLEVERRGTAWREEETSVGIPISDRPRALTLPESSRNNPSSNPSLPSQADLESLIDVVCRGLSLPTQSLDDEPIDLAGLTWEALQARHDSLHVPASSVDLHATEWITQDRLRDAAGSSNRTIPYWMTLPPGLARDTERKRLIILRGRMAEATMAGEREP